MKIVYCKIKFEYNFLYVTSFLSLYIQVKRILRYYSTRGSGIVFFDKLINKYISITRKNKIIEE